MPPVEPRLFHGTRDLLPAELLPRNDLLKTLVGVFERFGFAPVETPAMEFLDILLGKYGPEGEKLIYKLAYEDGNTLALRYDLTVPLARLVCMHPELPKPFKRYQIQPVWRADRPQPNQGRFREFYQCDVDTVGSASLIADAENVAVVHEGVLALGLRDFEVRVNNRKTLRGMVAWAGIDAGREADALRVLDKLDKVGEEGVRAELAQLGFAREPVDRLLRFSAMRGSAAGVLDQAGEILSSNESGRTGLAETREVLAHVEALGVDPRRIVVDLALTRGLDYYTGPVYEVVLTGAEKFGSLGGGGRYDDLLEVFGGTKTPATGVSIGLTRVLSALLKLGLLQARESPVKALVMRMPEAPVDAVLRIASSLRAAGLSTEVYLEPDKLKKQFQHAERKGIPFCVLPGSDEIARGEVNVKELATGRQETVRVADLAAYLGTRLQSPRA
jgi:histidyl-tRNA synthetase